MAIELCVETLGALAHATEFSVFTNLGEKRHRYFPRRAQLRIDDTPRRDPFADDTSDPAELAQRVRSATSTLPFPEAKSLWLIDVCGYSYDQAAEPTRSSRTVVADQLARARKAIRTSVS